MDGNEAARARHVTSRHAQRDECAPTRQRKRARSGDLVTLEHASFGAAHHRDILSAIRVVCQAPVLHAVCQVRRGEADGDEREALHQPPPHPRA